jgi:hypothetical protein
MVIQIYWNVYLYAIKKVRRHLCDTEKFVRTCMPWIKTLLPSMPLSPYLDQIGEGKVQNAIKAKCAINFF